MSALFLPSTEPMAALAPLPPRLATELSALRPLLDEAEAAFREFHIAANRCATKLAALRRMIEQPGR